jgi:hypothetical protein
MLCELRHNSMLVLHVLSLGAVADNFLFEHLELLFPRKQSFSSAIAHTYTESSCAVRHFM